MRRHENESTNQVDDLMGMMSAADKTGPMVPPDMSRFKRIERGSDGVYHDAPEFDDPTTERSEIHDDSTADPTGAAFMHAAMPSAGGNNPDDVMGFRRMEVPGYEDWAYRVNALTGEPILDNQGQPLLVHAGTSTPPETVDPRDIPDQGELELTETRKLTWRANDAAKPHLAKHMQEWIERNGTATKDDSAISAGVARYEPRDTPQQDTTQRSTAQFTEAEVTQLARRAFQAGQRYRETWDQQGQEQTAPPMQPAERREPPRRDVGNSNRQPAQSSASPAGTSPMRRPASGRAGNSSAARRETAARSAQDKGQEQALAKLRRVCSGKLGKVAVPVVLAYTFGAASMGIHTMKHLADERLVAGENLGISGANAVTSKAKDLPFGIGDGLAKKTHIQKKVAARDKYAFAGSSLDKAEAVVISPVGAAVGMYKVAKAPVYTFKAAKGMINMITKVGSLIP
ncbi:MAG TPA: hypothetical protein VFL85_01095 [Candidatus Saccharimonadales bacterium]|nr:hypothetical protein [Candidatus Saccharimonadales bacterium]